MRASKPLYFVIAATAVAAACSDRSLQTTAPLSPSARPSSGIPAPTTISVTTTLYNRDAGQDLPITRGDKPAAGFAAYTAINKITSLIGRRGRG